MSFLRKRSRSQCSFSKGDEEITVTKIQEKSICQSSAVETLRSEVSQSSREIEAADFAVHDSCVLRNFPKHKSSHLRFLAWVAYTRKYTDQPITEVERRTCPLLWCRVIFPDQETMLEHVWNCEHLAKGLYWCHHCQKPERVGKFQCKRCQGQPSRTDRLATVAKRVFSKLGARNHRREHVIPSTETQLVLAETSRPSEKSKSTFLQDSGLYGGYSEGASENPDLQELPNTYIMPEMPGDWTTESHELPDSSISEMMGSEPLVNPENSTENWSDNFYHEDLEITAPSTKGRASSPKLPRLETSFTSLNTQSLWNHRSQNYQQKYPSNWTDTPLSATIISPMSATQQFEPSSAVDISPTDSEASCNSFFTDSGYTSVTSLSTWDSVTGSFSRSSSLNSTKGKKRAWDCEAITEEQWDNFLVPDAPILLPVSITPYSDQSLSRVSSVSHSASACHSEQSLSRVSSVTHPAGRCPASEKAKVLSTHWTDAPSLVNSFSDVLDAHLHHTKAMLRTLPPNPMVTELLAMSKSSLVSVGLEVLAGILEGRPPTGFVQVFAFTHIACASAIVIDDDSTKVHTMDWFQDSLSWVSTIAPERQRQTYLRIAKSIWQPAPVSEGRQFSDLTAPLSKGNKILQACQLFMDVIERFENARIAASSSPNTSFNFAQLSFEFKAKSQVIDKLITRSSIEAFIEDVVSVEKRLQQGRISTIRELELELICAGKLASQSDTAYSRFIGHVIQLCDELYAEESGSAIPRAAHHIRDISLIKQLLPEDIYTDDDQGQHREADVVVHMEENLIDIDDFDSGSNDVEASIADFDREADDILNHDIGPGGSFQPQHEPTSMSRSTSFQPQSTALATSFENPYNSTFLRTPSTSLQRPAHSSSSYSPQPPYPISAAHSPVPPIFSQTLQPPTPEPTHPVQSLHPSITPQPSHHSSTTHSPAPPSSKPENKYHCHCGFVPQGEEKWKASNLRRHKRTQHSVSSKTYACRYPGCPSVFTRSDNLRSHQRDKGHEGHGVNVNLDAAGVNGGRNGEENGQEQNRVEEEGDNATWGEERGQEEEMGMDGQPLKKRRKLVPFDLEGYR